MNRAWAWRRRNLRVRRYWPDEPGIWRLFKQQVREHTGDPCVCSARSSEHPWAPGACTGVVPVVPLGPLRARLTQPTGRRSHTARLPSPP